MRSRLTLYAADNQQIGIISACAEQTDVVYYTTGSDWDHLRVCGADNGVHFFLDDYQGSSPRVRSRRGEHGAAFADPGIISACAEQTSRIWLAHATCRDHLRVCGADFIRYENHNIRRGSSPRVRSRQRYRHAHAPGLGIISACAEQTRRLS